MMVLATTEITLYLPDSTIVAVFVGFLGAFIIFKVVTFLIDAIPFL